MAKEILIKEFNNEKAGEAGFFSSADDRIRAELIYESEDLGRGSFKFEVGEPLEAGVARFEREVAFYIWFEENMFSSFSELVSVDAPIDDRGEPFTIVNDFVSNGKSCMLPVKYQEGIAALKDYAAYMIDLEFQFEARIPKELIEALGGA